jgi:hypothetical protein
MPGFSDATAAAERVALGNGIPDGVGSGQGRWDALLYWVVSSLQYRWSWWRQPVGVGHWFATSVVCMKLCGHTQEYGSTRPSKTRTQSRERQDRSAFWFGVNRRGGSGILHHRHVRPVLVREWSPRMDGIQPTIFASQTTIDLHPGASTRSPDEPWSERELRTGPLIATTTARRHGTPGGTTPVNRHAGIGESRSQRYGIWPEGSSGSRSRSKW